MGFAKGTLVNKAASVALSAALLAGTAAYPAFAATQGSVGATSTGTSTVTVTVASLARVTAVDDMDLGTWSGSGALSTSDDVCIWTTGGGYSITADGDGQGGAFELAQGQDTIAYSVKWAATAGDPNGTSLTAGTALTGQSTSATSSDCNAGANLTATVAVEIAEGDLSSAPSGAYSGVLTLVVAPE